MTGSDGDVDYIKYMLRLKPGAEAINLRHSVLYMSTYNDTLRLIYKTGGCTRDVANGYYTYR